MTYFFDTHIRSLVSPVPFLCKRLMEFQCTFADTKFIRQLRLDESTYLPKALRVCSQLGYSHIIFGRREILDQYDISPTTYFVVIDAEPGTLGQATEKKVFLHMSLNERNITFVTPNQDLQGLSDSIAVLPFDDLDRLRSPQSNLEWDCPISKKSKNISMLYSAKEYTTGHTIRTFIYNKYRDTGLIDFFTAQKGEEKIRISNRKNSLSYYRYNLIIENTFDDHHVSDQLKDAFLGRCVPIYMGNFTKFSQRFVDKWGVDISGIVQISNFGLDKAITSLGTDFYSSLLPSIETNYYAMHRRLSDLSWDGQSMINTDMSWLGDRVVNKLHNSLQNKLRHST